MGASRYRCRSAGSNPTDPPGAGRPRAGVAPGRAVDPGAGPLVGNRTDRWGVPGTPTLYLPRRAIRPMILPAEVLAAYRREMRQDPVPGDGS